MNKKTALQVLLVFIVFIIFLSFYLKYFNEEKKIVENKPIEEKTNNKNDSSTYIDNIDYISTDAKGNEYQVTAELGEIKIENSDIMLLTNVIAYIYVKDSDTIKITSNFGKYNSKNSDTNFSENVIIIYPGHKITGEYLDFSFLNNLGIMSINIIYKGEKINLYADELEIDLNTKDTKIFMNNTNKKVFIEGTK
jgi:LPS export ABC transporter protein LptC